MWPWNASTMGEVYLFHFHQPLGNLSNRRAQASHYVGFAEDLEARIAKQLAGRGAKIVAAALARGIGYDLYHWPACLLVEKLIKARKQTAIYCPTCARLAGRKPRPLPVPAVQLALDLEELPEIEIGRMGWAEIQAEASARRYFVRTPSEADLAAIDDLI